METPSNQHADQAGPGIPLPAAEAALPSTAPPTLKRNILYAVLGTGLFNLCRFGVVVLLAKFTTVEIVGQYDYALAISAPAVLFFGLQLRGAFVADAGGQFTFGSYRTLRLVGMVAAGAVLLPIIAWKARTEPSWVFLIILAGVCLGRIVEHVGEIYWGVYQKRERLSLLAGSAVLRGLALLAPFALLLPICHALTGSDAPGPDRLASATAWSVVIYVVGWALVLLLFDQRRVVGHADVKLSWDWPAVGKIAVQTLPLGLVALLITLCESVPRYVIEGQTDGKAMLGYFGPLAYLTLAGILLVSQASVAAGNRVAQYYRNDFAAFLRIASKLTGLAAGLGAAMLLVTLVCGRWLLGLLYTPEHTEHFDAFVILVLAQAALLLAVVFGALSTYMRLFWIQVPVQVIVLASTTLAAVMLIPGDPVRGGAWAALVRAAVQAVLCAACVLIGILRRPRSGESAPAGHTG
jgi:O-antigen/teichoic acid export membrane protein